MNGTKARDICERASSLYVNQRKRKFGNARMCSRDSPLTIMQETDPAIKVPIE